MSLNKYISKQIILAQVASDAAKGIYELRPAVRETIPSYRIYERKGYSGKDACIKRVLTAIQNKKHSGFYYHVRADHVHGGHKYCYLVYFNFKIEGSRFQISFHSFTDLRRYVSANKTQTRWQKKNDSRTSCLILNEVALKGNSLAQVKKKRGLL